MDPYFSFYLYNQPQNNKTLKGYWGGEEGVERQGVEDGCEGGESHLNA